jgi:hypothetical protein
VEAAHIRVTCDGCGSNTAEVCGKRDLPTMARVAAVRKFLAVGWQHDAVDTHAKRAPREGVGSDWLGQVVLPLMLATDTSVRRAAQSIQTTFGVKSSNEDSLMNVPFFLNRM